MTIHETKRGSAVEDHFGVAIADPYRWLEADMRRDPEVAAWVEKQDSAARTYLEELPSRDVFRSRLAALYNHERVTPPQKEGGRYFFTRDPAGDEPMRLIMREKLDGEDRVLVDPRDWAQTGAGALAEWSASPDGKYVAFGLQQGGTDWRTIRIVNVDSGDPLAEKLSWARSTLIAWSGDGRGFFYSRLPEPEEGEELSASFAGHAVYYHELGTPQSADRRIFSHPNLPSVLDVVGNGRYAIIYTSAVSGGNGLSVIDLEKHPWKPQTLVKRVDKPWVVMGSAGSKLFLNTKEGAERGRIVTVDLAEEEPTFREIVAEDAAVLASASIVGERIVAVYRVDAKSEVRRFRLDGAPDGRMDLPGIGSAGVFSGEPGDPEAFFTFTAHDVPWSVYRYDVATNRVAPWSVPRTAFDLDKVKVEQVFYPSKDGTRVPMFIIRRKDVAGPVPTILYAYGGYGISMVPYYSPDVMAWVEQGGAYAIANIRGGGEYGAAWHDAGRLGNKQNSFDDFIAAGEFLKAQRIASTDGLVAQGESNGALIVSAAVNQRPDLFAAALPGVGHYDMLRFARFTGGKLFINEVGDPSVEADFRTIIAYSPLHNIRPDRPYPAMLVTTADEDTRVAPPHSFKYVAALQHLVQPTKPILLRVARGAGHGAGTPQDKAIAEVADRWAFAAHWTKLHVDDRP
ncbi:prolyl oligopeptidase family serine peptidase [Qipengyuania qiaonensis]|uniref:prolyl oligopeptidase n=1 Tax=Qipengyuania qiaonensis TaxID=2867240 RepID=A0ABS7JEB9_9SPHN|nr:prolyl oligopeptidase family serine peptidase [Qipengyuania qiaonensis]MBX7483342.1 prolyl oligopeptidase family serine peptidase [Qipengyuania qiaonensis]